MIKDYDITLRGHHLTCLYTLYFLGEEIAMRSSMRKKKYSKEFIDFTISFLKKTAEFDLQIKIVSGILDDICRKCNHRDKVRMGCYSNGDDFMVIADVGLRENEVYSSKYILEKLEEVHKENKF